MMTRRAPSRRSPVASGRREVQSYVDERRGGGRRQCIPRALHAACLSGASGTPPLTVTALDRKSEAAAFISRRGSSRQRLSFLFFRPVRKTTCGHGSPRAIIQERVRAGLARAREAGTRLGRPTVGEAVEARIRQLKAAGGGLRRIAREVGVGTSVVQRVVKAAYNRCVLR